MKKIKITLHPDGTQKVEVLGARGSECLAFTEELEKRLITSAMKKADGNQSKASEILGINERNLRYKLKKYAMKM